MAWLADAVSSCLPLQCWVLLSFVSHGSGASLCYSWLLWLLWFPWHGPCVPLLLRSAGFSGVALVSLLALALRALFCFLCIPFPFGLLQWVMAAPFTLGLALPVSWFCRQCCSVCGCSCCGPLSAGCFCLMPVSSCFAACTGFWPMLPSGRIPALCASFWRLWLRRWVGPACCWPPLCFRLPVVFFSGLIPCLGARSCSCLVLFL